MGTRPSGPISEAGSFFSERAIFSVFLGFVAVTFLGGGGSRDDIASLTFLRPLAVICGFYAILAMRPGRARDFRALYLGLGAVAIFVAAQLVPLPPGLWAGLPGHELYARVAEASGTDNIWRPLSLVPSRTQNALFSLVVPIAGLLLVSALKPEYRLHSLRVLLVIGIVSGLLGFVQIAGPAGSNLYFYRITNDSDAVGLFANRNHHAVFLAALIPVAAYCCQYGFFGLQIISESRAMRQLAFAGMLVGLILAVLVTGSRAGLICTALMIVWASFMLRAARPSVPASRHHASKERWWQRWFWVTPLAMGALGGLAALVASRGSSIDRLLANDSLEGVRLQVLPTLVDMVWDFFPSGSGFGSFSRVYYQFEPDELLAQQYLNHAHNDWLQVVIEGGVLSVVGIVIAGLWLASRMISAIRRVLDGKGGSAALAAGGMWLCFIVASLVDYPIRVPSIMLTLVLCSTTFFDLQSSRGSRHGASEDSREGGSQSPYFN